MKTINLYFDFEFTSLSPDAQPISLGIVSDNSYMDVEPQFKCGNKLMDDFLSIRPFETKSFYAEFTDFDINRCDDWVKEKVVGKLRNAKAYYGDKTYPEIKDTKIPHACWDHKDGSRRDINGEFFFVKKWLHSWLKEFSDYQIQFVCDCGTFDWYWMLQLIGEWERIENEQAFTGECPTCYQKGVLNYRVGLPNLPSNISPVPLDLNDLIAHKKGISVKEAFDLNREELALVVYGCYGESKDKKHNALWDAQVIKSVYNRIK